MRTGSTVISSTVSGAASVPVVIITIRVQYGSADAFADAWPGSAMGDAIEMGIIEDQVIQHSELADDEAAHSRSEGHSL
jgi:hypothetical protein